MALSFALFQQRLREAAGLTSQMDIARALGVHRSAITQAKNRDSVPQKWVLALSRSQGLSPDWLEFGQGPSRLSGSGSRAAPDSASPHMNGSLGGSFSGAVLEVPRVMARLCAGGGGLELEAVPVDHHPFPLAWLSRMGRPEAMVFMDVIGNSMEPGIMDGDMVLVDQSAVALVPKSVMAVGYEEAIFIKRLEKKPNGLALVSDNPDYSPILIRGDELESFRIIGRVVWLCRDCG